MQTLKRQRSFSLPTSEHTSSLQPVPPEPRERLNNGGIAVYIFPNYSRRFKSLFCLFFYFSFVCRVQLFFFQHILSVNVKHLLFSCCHCTSHSSLFKFIWNFNLKKSGSIYCTFCWNKKGGGVCLAIKQATTSFKIPAKKGLLPKLNRLKTICVSTHSTLCMLWNVCRYHLLGKRIPNNLTSAAPCTCAIVHGGCLFEDSLPIIHF